MTGTEFTTLPWTLIAAVVAAGASILGVFINATLTNHHNNRNHNRAYAEYMSGKIVRLQDSLATYISALGQYRDAYASHVVTLSLPNYPIEFAEARERHSELFSVMLDNYSRACLLLTPESREKFQDWHVETLDQMLDPEASLGHTRLGNFIVFSQSLTDPLVQSIEDAFRGKIV